MKGEEIAERTGGQRDGWTEGQTGERWACAAYFYVTNGTGVPASFAGGARKESFGTDDGRRPHSLFAKKEKEKKKWFQKNNVAFTEKGISIRFCFLFLGGDVS